MDGFLDAVSLFFFFQYCKNSIPLMNAEEFDHNLCSVKMKANNNIQSLLMANSEGKGIPRKEAAWGVSA